LKHEFRTAIAFGHNCAHGFRIALVVASPLLKAKNEGPEPDIPEPKRRFP
jgi:hypothetical protein